MTTTFFAIAGTDLPADLTRQVANGLPYWPRHTSHCQFKWGQVFAATNSAHLVDFERITDGADHLVAFNGWALNRRTNQSLGATTLGLPAADDIDQVATHLSTLWEQCDGEWSGLVANQNGFAALSSPIGTHHVYVSHHRPSQTTIVANRARLIWAARTCLGLPCRRDDQTLARLLTLGYPFATDGTAVEDIRLVPSTSLLTLDLSTGSTSSANNKPRERPVNRLYFLPDKPTKPEAPNWDKLADVLRRNLNWLANIRQPGRAALTGGKDSRLVMAALSQSAVADRVDYYYLRAPKAHADAIAARQVATCTDLPFRRLDRPPPPDFAAALADHTAATEGLLNAWDLKYESCDDPFWGVHGLLGGIYRRRAEFKSDAPRQIAGQLLPNTMNWTGIVSDAAMQEQRAQIAAWLADLFAQGLPPAASADAWHLTWRLPRWMGQAKLHDGLAGIHFNPLYALEFIHAFERLSLADQRDQRLHFELMARFNPDLVTLPFAHANWPADMVARSTRPDLVSPKDPVTHAEQLVGTGWQRPALQSGWDDHRQEITAIAHKLGDYVDAARLELALDVAEAHLVTGSRRRLATTALRAPLLTARYLADTKGYLQQLFGLLTIAALDDELR